MPNNAAPLLLLAAVIAFIIGIFIAWPGHIWVAAFIGLACFAGSFLVAHFHPTG